MQELYGPNPWRSRGAEALRRSNRGSRSPKEDMTRVEQTAVAYAHRRRARAMRSAIRRKAGFLATAGLIEYALQLGVPVILVRHLTKQGFGDYRLMWLVAET